MLYTMNMSQDQPSYAHLANIKFIEELYEKWLENPSSVDHSWKNFFEGMQFASVLPKALPPRRESADLRIHDLINAYRTYGHLMTKCDAIAVENPSLPKELQLDQFGFTEADLEKEFPTCGFIQEETALLKKILLSLQETYCKMIGIEYMNLGSIEMEKWIQKRIEPYFSSGLNTEEKIEILKQLNAAEGFETFLHTKYVGQKRFSLEGTETIISLLHMILEKGAELGISDVILGMAHRGRLNVLANIMGKSYAYIFEEFEDYYTPDLSESTGDVKYHMGFAGTYKTKNNKTVQVILSANPSHLEAVNPVVEGEARAIQELKAPRSKASEVVPLLIHGDAAVTGQGIIYETMTLSRLKGYETKGTIHIVINNQIGFTTLPKDGRSTHYCTDIAKTFGAPVFHVNAEDPESCVAVARLAIELRQQFNCDVFIDLMGYRKYGHNEGDEPTFTQPLQYQIIHAKKTIREIYRDRLIEESILSQDLATNLEKEFKEKLNQILSSVRSKASEKEIKKLEMQTGRHLQELLTPFETKVPQKTLIDLGMRFSTVPEGFNIHKKLLRLLKERQEMLNQDPKNPTIDWGMGELLAYASLCAEDKIHVRLSGQDCRRGTFSHRHAIFVDQITSNHYFPLSHLKEGQAPCDIFNSPLSEMGVLGFEFGYSLMYQKSLVLWEAQYGDFCNGAQIIIDQFLSSSEMKWGLSCNITLLLPHGYEGSGPEHSSARIERFLQLSGDENMIIANCTSPAQFFHLLRRQGLRKLKKPLIVFTHKTLRHPLLRSPFKEFSEGIFSEILDDPSPPKDPNRLCFCSGKIFFELIEQREKQKEDFAIVRIEQLYPLHEEKLKAIFQKYQTVHTYHWVQEEHENMGAWEYMRPHLRRLLGEKASSLTYIGRRRSAATAAGSHALHAIEHQRLLQTLFTEGSKP